MVLNGGGLGFAAGSRCCVLVCLFLAGRLRWQHKAATVYDGDHGMLGRFANLRFGVSREGEHGIEELVRQG
uniref:Putative secreted protein n=1 Tax=Anopheles triannulatus TaxID=58253 RepID=A0A2M4B4E6_9DIPT